MGWLRMIIPNIWNNKKTCSKSPFPVFVVYDINWRQVTCIQAGVVESSHLLRGAGGGSSRVSSPGQEMTFGSRFFADFDGEKLMYRLG